MLVASRLVKNTSVERMVRLWAARYVPDLSTLSLQTSQCTASELVEAASPEGRSHPQATSEHF